MSTVQTASPAAPPPPPSPVAATATADAAVAAAQSMVVTAAATVAAATTAASVVTPHLSTPTIVTPKSIVPPSASRPPPATSALKSFTPLTTSQPSDEANTAPHQPEAASYSHLRSKSVSFATLAVRPSKQMTGVVMHQQQLQPLQRSRQSVSFTGVLGSRRAQLSLLAEQANLAAVGTSSLKVARASSLVMDEAVKAALVHATSEDSASVDDRDATSGPSASAAETVDKAWQETLSADGFLSSASSLAQLFQTQEQSRKDWAGQALALQRRRWTMDPSSASSREEIRTAAASSCNGKRPALDEEDEEESRQEARIVEINGDETMTQAQVDEAARDTDTSFKKRRRSEHEVSATTGVAVGPSVESDAAEALAITKGRALSNTNTPRPQLLVNVLASFETLLDARQQACAGLAELARTADELSTFQPAVPAAAAAAATRVQRSRAASPHTITDTAAAPASTAATPPVFETSEEEFEDSDETYSSSGDNASPIDVKLAEQVDAAVRRRSG